jgi:hypothetical protein
MKFFPFVLIIGYYVDAASLKSHFNHYWRKCPTGRALTYFPSTVYALKQVSSYNPASVTKDSTGWFENYDMSHFRGVVENQGRREFILFDVDGPGAIVRWWMTFYKAHNGIIRVYLDNAMEPVIEGPDEVLSGDLLAGYPFSASLQKGAPV